MRAAFPGHDRADQDGDRGEDQDHAERGVQGQQRAVAKP
jgi:hypothetical protein